MKNRYLVPGVLLVVVGFALSTAQAFAVKTDELAACRVRDFGAAGDGATKDTVAVQRAIDACADAGGGTVYFASGAYLCGSLHLKSDVALHLDAGATILGSPDKDDYDPYEKLDFENDADEETSYFHYALIWGEDLHKVAIVGHGTIDGNRNRRHGPKPIALKRCCQVEIRGIRIVNAPNYCISLLGTDNVNIDGVTILNGYCDGIDPDSCKNVRISNCHIESRDDAIVPKASFALGERRASENIMVTNCYLATRACGFKLGTESGGGFKRIAVSNCVIARMRGEHPVRAGIAIESVDGAELDGVVVSNITMIEVRAPIFIRLGNRGRDMDEPAPGSLRSISIDNIVARKASLACSITGIPGHPVEGVTLSNIRIHYVGGGPYRAPDEAVPEVEAEYPDARMFDGLPAYGFYCRHVDGLTLSNIDLSFDAESYWRVTARSAGDIRWFTRDGIPTPHIRGKAGPAIVCDDVERLSLDGLRAQPAPEGDPVLRFINVRDALIRGCRAEANTGVFLEVVGAETKGISVIGNDFRKAKQALVLLDAKSEEVELLANAEARTPAEE